MNTENQYDAIAERYDSLFNDKASIKENEQVARMLCHVQTPVMDIGCGTGLLIDLLSVMDNEYIGVDPSAKMLEQFRHKHPKHKSVNIPFEWLNPSQINYRTAVALFGSASYIRENALRSLPRRRRLFLMFYKEDYHPVTYERSGHELKHYSYSRRKLYDMFPQCRIKDFGNYYIVTNV